MVDHAPRLDYTTEFALNRMKCMSMITTESGLQIEEIRIGTGEPARSGQFVSVHYTGWLTSGSKFDSSKDRDDPFDFPLGQQNVIAGWDEGVQGMRIGGVRKLTIPPNATLVFEVELLDILGDA
jgi:FKBP-type peptidyl-prolyl cis-trans isomerase FkpA